MNRRMRTYIRLAAALTLLSAWTSSLHAQTDEIQVYNAEIAAPGVFNLTLHDNFTPDGRTSPSFPGGIVPNHTLNGVPEWAYGVTDWFEAGLYLPLYSISGTGASTYNGFKIRTLFVEPNAADQRFFYGVNFEYSWNTAHWDQNRNTQEIRPISCARSPCNNAKVDNTPASVQLAPATVTDRGAPGTGQPVRGFRM
jgi:hypothetical protein